MAPSFGALFTLLAVVLGASAVPLVERAPPTVTLDGATVTGAASGKVDKFLGIPFAEPPIGDLRFRLPQLITKYTDDIDAKQFGASCPQQAIQLPLPDGLLKDTIDAIVNTLYPAVFPDDEDCLTINVVKPASATPDSKLPVLVWIFGGGFEIGSTSMYDGGIIVERSLAIDEPVIYVSMNYRVAAFGFLASQEVKDAAVGNLGLQDRDWVQQYIGQFGGDPEKVTIWGESAGAISVALHMLTNDGNTEGLFRGAVMNSGSPIPVGDITNGQIWYDQLVAATGCTNSKDTLQCLREVPYEDLKAAQDDTPFVFSYQSLILTWLPRADGVFLKDNPQALVKQGSVANVPFISGDCDDEGTLFSFSTLNITTDAQARDYVSQYWLPRASSADIDALFELYPSDPKQGSPYDTGSLNALTPQFKRIASFQGDTVFQGPRRYFMRERSGKQDMWAFINKRLKGLPALGSFHASDLLNAAFGLGEMSDYTIRFTANLDPNGKNATNWPKYTSSTPQMLSFNDGLIKPLSLTQDTYRAEAMDKLIEVMQTNPI
ncbi:Alpha/Beta hydrolase protein [Schizophyllum commune]